MSEVKRSVQDQFGRNTQGYITAQNFSQGYSLGRLKELITLPGGTAVLDIGTGGGHTALAFAPGTGVTIASDLTHPMLKAAREHAEQASDTMICFCQHEANHLPYPSASFDLVTCRIAAHHFPDVTAFVTESARVLKPGGTLAITDMLASGDPRTAKAYNNFEKLRDPSHVWAYSFDDWQAFISGAGLKLAHTESTPKALDFDEWTARMSVSEADYLRLKALLLQAPEDTLPAWLTPKQEGQRLTFHIHEGIFLANKAA